MEIIMKYLLFKEFKLAAHPTTFIFLSLSLMLLIPSYPYYVAFFYTLLSIFFVFLSGRENKDVFYTVLLPIRKRDTVKARCLMVAIIQLAQIIISVPVAILSNYINTKGNLAGIDANVAFFGLVFVMLALFNIIFIPTFYKTAYNAGRSFLYGCIAITVFIGAAEALVWMPSPIKAFLDTSEADMMLKQLPILLAGIVIWVLTMLLAYKKASASFEKVDI